jgi:hypothetical protein
MCNPNTLSVTLQTAVLMQIQEFVNSGQMFSRYDITLAIRRKCNDGLLEIPAVENTNPGAINRFPIHKTAVDDIFEQLYQNCLINGLPPLRYDFDRTKGYRLFSVDTTAQTTIPVPVPISNVTPMDNKVVNVPSLDSVFSSTASPANTTMVTMSDGEIRRRVGLYMDRCRKIGATPTIKQIQSAIKRKNKSTGLSYREITNITTSMGYKV